MPIWESAQVLELLVGVTAGFVVALLFTPVGVSGAVLLLPAQTNLLGLAGPAVSSTNLLFNVVSTPGGLARFGRTAAPGRREVVAVLVVAVPAAVGGALLRVTVLADADAFRVLVAAALLPIAATLVWRCWHPASTRVARSRPGSAAGDLGLGRLAGLSALTSLIGAAVGFGGGSLLAPALIVATARGPRQVAPLALLATLATSVTGLAAYTVLEAIDVGARPAAPDWLLGTITGLGGLAGSLLGAHLQPRLDERLLTGLLALLVTTVAAVQLLRG